MAKSSVYVRGQLLSANASAIFLRWRTRRESVRREKVAGWQVLMIGTAITVWEQTTAMGGTRRQLAGPRGPSKTQHLVARRGKRVSICVS